ncbi:phage repressor protein CI [Citrobacter freundii]|uniref:phage repressor protein CI n=4 Tax=Citrobacter freundii TaxID=546 RepID=UPI000738D134|nr:phage repressor protein CI [Citrobacter freundii]QSB80959.1 phage repressor protein CI [Citrobacter freundii]QSB97505.1 phage repressor protein CI [Citrobacter freundii]
MDLRRGGKAAIDRMIEAYGFTTKQSLCEQLGISSSTLANRYLRDTFPADYVIQCSLETGVSLRWLVFGEGEKNSLSQSSTISLPTYRLEDGKVFSDGFLAVDKRIIPDNTSISMAYSTPKKTYLAQEISNNIIDGEWVVKIDSMYSIRKIFKMPNNKIKIINDDISFESNIDDVELIAKIIITIS